MNATSVSRLPAAAILPLYRAETLEDQADMHLEKQQWKPAATLLQQALGIRESACGKQDPGNARLLDKIGSANLRCGLPEQATEIFRQAENLLEARYHPGHGQLAPILEHHADALLVQSKPEQAEPLLRRAQEIYAKTETMENHNTLRAMLKLARLYLAQRKSEQAEAIIGAAMKHVDTPLGPVAEFRYQLALAYVQEGKQEEAKTLLDECIGQFKQRHNYGRVADCFEQQSKLAGSEPQLHLIAKYRQLSLEYPYPTDIFLATLLRA